MFSKYYLEELAYLRDMGREFARRHPETGGMLSEAGADPDVERLLEGFAFLTARIREKLDDELPEFTHSLLELFWPHYLRPIPALSIAQFTPTAKQQAKLGKIPRGTPLASKPVDQTICEFRTCYETELVPLRLEEVEVGPSASPYLRLRIAPLQPAAFAKLGLSRLRLHFGGDAQAGHGLRYALLRYLKGIRVKAAGVEPFALPEGRVLQVGFESEQALVPSPVRSFDGFRLLQEYLCYPKKFLFVDLVGLEPLAQLGAPRSFDLICELEALPHDLPPVGLSEIQLNCTPIVNLFPREADPIDVDHTRARYLIRPSGQRSHYEVHGVERVRGVAQGRSEARTYQPFFSFDRKPEEHYYKTQRVGSPSDESTDLYVSFPGQVGAAQAAPGTPQLAARETISLELTCTNRQLPRGLGVGEICEPAEGSVPFATFRNLDPPAPAVPPPLKGDVFWGLLGHLSLNLLSLTSAERLREMLGLYHFRALSDRQAAVGLRRRQEGILEVKAGPETRMLGPSLVRGVHVRLKLDEESFGSGGAAYLFGDVMDRFFAQYVSLNAYSRLEVKGQKFGEVHTWPARSGTRDIL